MSEMGEARGKSRRKEIHVYIQLISFQTEGPGVPQFMGSQSLIRLGNRTTADLLHCTAETSATLYSYYTPIKKNNFSRYSVVNMRIHRG